MNQAFRRCRGENFSQYFQINVLSLPSSSITSNNQLVFGLVSGERFRLPPALFSRPSYFSEIYLIAFCCALSAHFSDQIYNIFEVDKNQQEMKDSMAHEQENDPHFREFVGFLHSPSRFGSKQDDYYHLKSYCLSKLVQEKIQNAKMGAHGSQIPSFQAVCRLILQDQQISSLCKSLQAYQKEYKPTNNKDRKTSFFRIINKHLRAKHRKGSKAQSSPPNPALATIQFKLSHNTISKDDIQQLISKSGPQIIQYLASPKVYEDILNINKSRVNKCFYLLHLRAICIEARNGRLSCYSFFHNTRSLQEQIEYIARVLYNEIWDSSAAKMERIGKIPMAETSFTLKESSDFPELESLAISTNDGHRHDKPSFLCSNYLYEDEVQHEMKAPMETKTNLFDILQEPEVKLSYEDLL